MEREEIFANNATDKGLFFKTYKQLIQLNTKKKKTGRRHKQTLLQRHTDGQQAHEKMLNITIREMKMKTTMKSNPTPVRMAIMKKIYK